MKWAIGAAVCSFFILITTKIFTTDAGNQNPSAGPTPQSIQQIIQTMEALPEVRDADIACFGDKATLVLIVRDRTDAKTTQALGNRFIDLVEHHVKFELPLIETGKAIFDYMIVISNSNAVIARGNKGRVDAQTRWKMYI